MPSYARRLVDFCVRTLSAARRATPSSRAPAAGLVLLIGLITAPAQAQTAAAPAPSAAASSTPAAKPAPLDSRLQDLKAEALRLSRDLQVLEEELLFPPGTQFAVFLSVDAGAGIELESVQVQVDGQLVASHLYQPHERQALQRGGVQRLHLGNLRTGKHSLSATFSGRSVAGRESREAREIKGTQRFELDKGDTARYVDLRLRDALRDGKPQADFEVKVWP